MEYTLVFGCLVLFGFLLGEVAEWIRLPKITGYILAGIVLRPVFDWLQPGMIVPGSRVITDIALSFITFTIGGSLLYPQVRKLGKTILSITVLAAEIPFLLVFAGLMILCPLGLSRDCVLSGMIIPFSLLMGSLASPTDPSAPLAVIHEYGARGEVTSTIMGIAALDDVLAIVNFSFAVVIAQIMLEHTHAPVISFFVHPVYAVFGAVILGIVFGVLFNLITPLLGRETEGAFIVLILGMLTMCFGIAKIANVEEMLATMAMGVVVVNCNPSQEKVFRILDRYVDELVFVLFFTLSGMFLDFGVLSQSLLFVGMFMVLRAAGKIAGTVLGARLTRASAKIRRYTAGGLLPQGGIVIGMALLIQENPAFDAFSGTLMGVIIGATVLHELFGPVIARISLQRAGEIGKDG
ncbi:MAG: cation:proton antiporter [Deltaproteobacteria bacterium]|nr:cation:proton antiporter [Deltaproteobacteria bacterium]